MLGGLLTVWLWPQLPFRPADVLGLPADWPVLVDEAVAKTGSVVIGSGIRGSKLRLPGRLVAALPLAQVLPGLGVPVNP